MEDKVPESMERYLEDNGRQGCGKNGKKMENNGRQGSETNGKIMEDNGR